MPCRERRLPRDGTWQHKGLDYRPPVEEDPPLCRYGPVLCRERLGGLLKTYYRGAA